MPYFLVGSFCTDINVPEADESIGTLTLNVTFSNPEFADYNISAEHEVRISRGSTMTFIQTDKKLYQLGQEVKFRIITLDFNLRPILDAVSSILLLYKIKMQSVNHIGIEISHLDNGFVIKNNLDTTKA